MEFKISPMLQRTGELLQVDQVKARKEVRVRVKVVAVVLIQQKGDSSTLKDRS
jgi:hypothetical protein